LLLLAQICPLQASLINTTNPRRIVSTDGKKRRNIPSNPSQSRHERPLTYGNKLVYPNQTAEPNTSLNLAVTPYLHKVTHDNPIFKCAVVPNVRTDHKEIIISYSRQRIRMNAHVDCHLLVNNVSVTYHKPAGLAVWGQTQCLRAATNHTIGKKVIIFPNLDALVNHHIGIKYRVGAD
jgi:hypothetical protein